MSPSANTYFRRLSATGFEATRLTSGAWNPEEQHIAPVIGLLAHLVEADHRARGGRLTLASVSCDILGVLPVGPFDVEVRVLRPGRTIELVEATLTQSGRAGAVLRGWMLLPSDTSAHEGSAFAPMPPVDETPEYGFGETWDGEFVQTIEARQQGIEPGRARSWVRTSVPLLEGEEVSGQARLIGLLDVANGLSPRLPQQRVAFPNVDLNASFFRVPQGDWLGLDTTQSAGAGGVGLTESVVHDALGPVGSLSQTLTIRG